MTAGKRECFVVMGYGIKTDPDTSKTFDLDKTYRSIIEVAVRQAGLEPVRADRVLKTGAISRQMYQSLMDAELVVCDLTTLNPNALFELGVRMALRPRATVVIAAEGTKIPFNLKDERFFYYKHGGEVIDYEDASQAQTKLKQVCEAALASREPDSLIYAVFHRELEPPRWIHEHPSVRDALPTDTIAAQRKRIDDAKTVGDWKRVASELKHIHQLAGEEERPVDAWFTQQWALATYKQSDRDGNSELPDLKAARDILHRLAPRTTTDAETLGLWAAVHRRLAEHAARDPGSRANDLRTAIAAYRKGYVLRDDHYNGVNYAFLSLQKAIELPDPNRGINVRDFVEAREAWQRVVALCVGDLDDDLPSPDKQERREQLEESFWRTASLAQALIALSDNRYTQARDRMEQLQAQLQSDWMIHTSERQEHKLRQLLARQEYRQLAAD